MINAIKRSHKSCVAKDFNISFVNIWCQYKYGANIKKRMLKIFRSLVAAIKRINEERRYEWNKRMNIDRIIQRNSIANHRKTVLKNNNLRMKMKKWTDRIRSANKVTLMQGTTFSISWNTISVQKYTDLPSYPNEMTFQSYGFCFLAAAILDYDVESEEIHVENSQILLIMQLFYNCWLTIKEKE